MQHKPKIIDEKLWCVGCTAKYLCLQGFKYADDCHDFKMTLVKEMKIKPWLRVKTAVTWKEIFGNG